MGDIQPTNSFDPSAPETLQEPGEVVGNIALERSSDDVGTVTVTLQGPETITAPVNEDGSFSLTGAAPGRYELIAIREGYRRERRAGVDVALSAVVDVGELRMLRARGVLFGQVDVQADPELEDDPDPGEVDVVFRSASPIGSENQALNSVSQALRPAQEADPIGATEVFTVTTGPDGRFVAEQIPVGTYLVVAQKPGLDPYCAGFWTVTQDGPGAGGGNTEITGISLVPLSALMRVTGPEGTALPQVLDSLGTPIRVTSSDTLSLALLVSGATQMRLSLDPDALPNLPLQPFDVAPQFDISDVPDGIVTIYGQFLDNCEQLGGVQRTRVLVDRTPPAILSLRIDGGADFLSDGGGLGAVEAVASDNGGSGLAAQRVFINGEEITAEGGRDFLSSSVESFGAEPGPKTVGMIVIDRAGNASELVEDTIFFDPAPPACTLTLLGRDASGALRDDGLSTDSELEYLADCAGDAVEMILAPAPQTPDCLSGAYRPFSPAGSFEFGGSGEAVLQGCFRDAAGNASGVVSSAPVRIDDVGPVGLTLQVHDGDGWWNALDAAELGGLDVPVSFSAGEDARFELSLDANFVAPIAGDYIAPDPLVVPIALPPLELVPQRVFLRMLDSLGNVSEILSQEITLDTGLPSGAISLVGRLADGSEDAGFTVDAAQVRLEVAAVGATRMRISSNDAPDCRELEVYEALVERVDPFVLGGEGAERRAWACLADAAGNFTPEALVADIRVDDAAPSCTIAIFGLDADGAPDSERTLIPELRYQIDCDETPAEMFLSGSGGSPNCATASYSAFTQSGTFAIEDSEGDGKLLRGCFRDGVRNTSAVVESNSLRFDRSAVLRGRVVRDDGSAAAGASITVRDSGDVELGTATTSDRGEYSFAAVAPGTHRVIATLGDHRDAETDVTLRAGATVQATEMVLRRLRGGLEGHAFKQGEEAGGHGGIRVTVVDAAGATQATDTDGDGAWNLSGLAAGAATVRFAAQGFTGASGAASVVAEGSTVVADVTLDFIPGSIEGVVALETGAALSGLSIVVTPTAGTVQLTDDGYRIVGLQAGSYTLTASHSGYVAQGVNVGVFAGESAIAPAILLTRLRSSVRGSVLLEEVPTSDFSGTFVQLIGPGYSDTAVTDTSGEFRFGDVPVGDGYRVEASRADFTTLRSGAFDVDVTAEADAGVLRLRPQRGDFTFVQFPAVSEPLDVVNAAYFQAAQTPHGSGGVLIALALDLEGQSGDTIRISQDPDFDDARYGDVVSGDMANFPEFGLLYDPDRDLGEGVHTVYLEITEAGTPRVLTGQIDIDTLVPEIRDFALAGGAAFVGPLDTGEVGVTLVFADEGTGVRGMLLGEGDAPATCPEAEAGYVTAAGADTLQLVADATDPALQGELAAWGCVRDGAGNVSLVATDTVGYDMFAPFIDEVRILGADSGFLSSLLAEVQIDITEDYAECDGAPCPDFSAVPNPAALTGLALSTTPTACDSLTYRAVSLDAASAVTIPLLLDSAEGARTVYACVRDAAGKLRGPVASSNNPPPVLDLTAPENTTAELQCGGAPCGAVYGAHSIQVALSAVGASRAVLSGNGLAATVEVTDFVGGQATADVELSAGDGFKSFELRYFDAAGNVAPSLLLGLLIDTDGPGGELRLTGVLGDGNESSAVTTSTDGNRLTILASGEPTQMKVGNGGAPIDCSDSAGYEAFRPGIDPLSLADIGAELLAQVCLKDAAGNITAQPLEARIAYDATAPACTISLQGRRADGTANEASAGTASTVVDFTIDCGGETPAGMILVPSALSPNCASDSYGPFATSGSVAISPVDGGDKGVIGCFVDSARNASGQVSSNLLVLDQRGPAGLTLVAGDGSGFWTDAANLEVPLSFSGDEDGTFELALEPGFAAAVTGNYSAGAPGGAAITIADLQGVAQQIYFRLIDALGNASTVLVVELVLDSVAPDGAIEIIGVRADGDASTVVTTALDSNRLSIDSFGATRMRVATDAAPDCSQLESYVALQQVVDPLVLGGAGAQRSAWVCLADEAGNFTANALRDDIAFDQSAPSCTLTVTGRNVDGTSNATASATRSVDYVVDCGGEVPVAMLLSAGDQDPDCAGGDYGAFIASGSAQLEAGDGAGKLLKGCFVDAAGFVAGPVSSNALTLDTQGPGGLALQLGDGSGFWTDAGDLSVPASFDANESGSFALALNEEFADAVSGVFSPGAPGNAAVTIADVQEQAQTVYFRLTDGVGNASATLTRQITLDTVSPDGLVEIIGTLANGEVSRESTSVLAGNRLSITADGASRMLVATDAEPDCSQLGSYIAFRGLIDPFVLGGAGTTRDAWVCLADTAGNFTATALHDTIGFDDSAPACTLTLVGRNADGSANATASATTAVDYSIDCGGDVIDGMILATGADPDCANGSYVSFSAAGTAQIAAGDGAGKTLKGCFRDASFNTSAAAVTSNALTLDTTPPGLLTLQVGDGSGFWTDPGDLDVPVTFGGSESGSFAVALNRDFVDAVTGAYTTGATDVADLTIAGDEGVAQSVFFRLSDSLGNASDILEATITLDTTAPVGSIQIIGERANGEPSAEATATLVSNQLSITTDGATRMLVATDAEPDCSQLGSYVAFSALTDPFVLGGSGGTRNAWVCLADGAGNFTATALTDSIIFDNSAPSCAITVTGRNVDGSANATQSARTTVDFSVDCGGDAITGMAIFPGSQSPNCAIVAYNAFSATGTAELDPGDGAGKNIKGCFQDAAGNVSGTAAISNLLALDTVAPASLTLQVGDGSGFWTDPLDLSVPVTFGGGESGSYALALNRDFTGAVTGTYTTGATDTDNVTIVGAEGVSETIYFRLVDGVGNASEVLAASIEVDTTAPVGSIQIIGERADGEPSTEATATLVSNQLSITTDGATRMRVATDAEPDCSQLGSYVPFSALTDPFVLGGNGGTRNAWVCLADGAGNFTATALTDSIIFDNSAPSCAITVAGRNVDGSANATQSASTTADFSVDCGGDAITGMAIFPGSQSPNCANVAYNAFSATGTAELDPGDGAGKNIKGCFQDAAGNVSGTAAISNLLALDTVAPASLTLQVGDGSGFWTDPLDLDVPVTFGGAESGSYALALNRDFTGAVTGSYTTGATDTDNVTIVGTEGVSETIYFRLVDGVGNASDVLAASIEVDTTAPVGSIQIIGERADGEPSTEGTATLVSNQLSITTDGATRMRVATDAEPDCSQLGSYVPFSALTDPFVLGGSGGTRNAWVCLADGAGNFTATALTDSILYDATAPVCSVAITGRKVDGSSDGATTATTTVDFTTDCGGDAITGMAIFPGSAAPNCATVNYNAFADAGTAEIDPVDGAGKTLKGCFQDAAGNVSAVVATSNALTLDTTAPTSLTLQLANGDGYWNNADSSNATDYDITVTFGGGESGTYRLALDDSFSAATTGSYTSGATANATVTLASTEDVTQTIFFQLVDPMGNVSGTISRDIVVDTVAPSGSIEILGLKADGSEDTGVTATLTTNKLRIDAIGATQMSVATDSEPTCSSASFTALDTLIDPLSLGGSGTTRNAWACLADDAGNITASALTDSITYDGTAPSCTITITGRKVDGSTDGNTSAGTTVDYSINCGGDAGVTGMVLVPGSQTPNCTSVSYDALVDDGTTEIDPGDGPGKVVRGCFQDVAGNTSAAAVTSNNLALDTTAPSSLTLQLANGDGYWNNADSSNATDYDITVTFGGGESGTYRLALDDSFSAATTGSYTSGATANATVTLASTEDVTQTVFFQLVDPMGNVSGTISRGIVVDTVAPSGSIEILGLKADGSEDTGVTATLTTNKLRIDAIGATQMSVATDSEPTCSSASFTALDTLIDPLSLGGSGTTRNAWACLADDAGNITASALTDSITYDGTAPSCTITITGREVDGTANASKTAGTSVDYSISCTGGDPTEMILVAGSQSPNCATDNYDGFQASGAAQIDPQDGTGKLLRGCFRDLAGNATTSAVSSNSLTLDTTAPGSLSLTLHDGDGWWNNADSSNATDYDVSMTFSAGESGTFEASLNDDFSGAVTGSYTTGSADNGTLTIASTEDLLQRVYFRVTDDVGNVSDTIFRDIIVDTVLPDGSILLVGLLADSSQSLSVTTNAASNRLEIFSEGATRMLTGTSTAPTCSDLGSYSTLATAVDPFALGGSGTPRTAYACLADDAGNFTAAPLSDTIAFDDAGPTGCTITLTGRRADGTVSAPLTDTKTAAAQVGYAITGCNETPVQMALAADDITCGSASFGAFQAGGTILLSDGDATGKDIHGCFKDSALNVSDEVTSANSLELDTRGPSAVVLELNKASSASDFWNAQNVSDAGGTPYAVPATMSADEAGTYRLSLSSDFSSATSGSFSATSTTANFTIASDEGTLQIVYLQIIDELGNESLVTQDTITVDTLLPTVNEVNINNDDKFTNSVSVSLLSDVEGAEEMALSLDGTNFSAFQPYTFYVIYLLDGSVADGNQTVFFRFRDAALNTTDGSDSDVISLDRTAPQAPVIAETSTVVNLEGSTDQAVTLSSAGSDNLSSIAAENLFYQVKGGSTYPAWTTLAAGDGSPTEPPFTFTLNEDVENRLGVRLIDGAGNISAEDFVTYTEDSTAPEAPDSVEIFNGDGTVLISWADSTSEDVVGYRVYYGATSQFDGEFANEGSSPITVGDINEFRLNGLPNGSPIFVAIEAFDRVPLYSGLSNQVRADPNTLTPDVAGLFGGQFKDVATVRRNSDGQDYVAALTDNSVFIFSQDPGGLLDTPSAVDPVEPLLFFESFGQAIAATDRNDGFGLTVVVGETGHVDFYHPDLSSGEAIQYDSAGLGFDEEPVEMRFCDGRLLILTQRRDDDDQVSAGTIYVISFESTGFPFLSGIKSLSTDFPNGVQSLECHVVDPEAPVTFGTQFWVLGKSGTDAKVVHYNNVFFDNFQELSSGTVTPTASDFVDMVLSEDEVHLVSFDEVVSTDRERIGQSNTVQSYGSTLFAAAPSGAGRSLGAFLQGAELFVVGNDAVTGGAARVLSINPQTGATSINSTSGSGFSVEGGLRVNALGDYAFAAAGTGGVISINVGSGATSSTGEAFGRTIAVDHSHGLAWVLSDSRLTVLNVTNINRPIELASTNIVAEYSGEPVGPLDASGISALTVAKDDIDGMRYAYQFDLEVGDNLRVLGDPGLFRLQLPDSDQGDFYLDSLALYGSQIWVSYYANGEMRLMQDGGIVDSEPVSNVRSPAAHDCIAVSDRVLAWCLPVTQKPDGSTSPEQMRVRICRRTGPGGFEECNDQTINTSKPDFATLSLRGDYLYVAADTVQVLRIAENSSTGFAISAAGEVNTQSTYKALPVGDELVLTSNSSEFSMPIFANDNNTVFDLIGTLKDYSLRDMVVDGHSVLLASDRAGLAAVDIVRPQTFIPLEQTAGVREGRLTGVGPYLIGSDPQSMFMILDLTRPNPVPSRVSSITIADMETSGGLVGYTVTTLTQNNVIKLLRNDFERIENIGIAQAPQAINVVDVDDDGLVYTQENDGKFYTYDLTNPFEVIRNEDFAEESAAPELFDMKYTGGGSGSPPAFIGGADGRLVVFNAAAPLGARITVANIPGTTDDCTEVDFAPGPPVDLALAWCGNNIYPCTVAGTLVTCETDAGGFISAGRESDGNQMAVVTSQGSGVASVVIYNDPDLELHDVVFNGPGDILIVAGPTFTMSDDPTALTGSKGTEGTGGFESFAFVGFGDGTAQSFLVAPGLLEPGERQVLSDFPIQRLRADVGFNLVLAADVAGLTQAFGDFALPVLATLGWLGAGENVEAWGNRVYSEHPRHGVAISDITTPTKPVVQKQLLDPSITKMAAHDHLLFTGDGDGIIRLYDATDASIVDLTAPNQLVNLGANISWMYSARGLLFAGAGTADNWLSIFDYRTLANPGDSGKVDCSDTEITTGTMMGDLLILGDGTPTLQVVRLGDYDAPSGDFSLSCDSEIETVFGPVQSVRSSGPYLYVATGNGLFENGVEVYEFDEFEQTFALIAASPTSVRVSDIFPYGSKVYTTPETGSGMQTYEVE